MVNGIRRRCFDLVSELGKWAEGIPLDLAGGCQERGARGARGGTSRVCHCRHLHTDRRIRGRVNCVHYDALNEL